MSASFAGGTAVTLTATPGSGSTFLGWSGGATGTNPVCTVTLNANAIVRATFGILDTVPPTVSITSPIAGSLVAGNVALNASASDNVGIAGVQFQLDGASLGAEDLVAPY